MNPSAKHSNTMYMQILEYIHVKKCALASLLYAEIKHNALKNIYKMRK